MSKTEPTIQKFMTTQPESIDGEQTVESAVKLMAEKNIRHLPVMKEGAIFGIVSDRDIKTATALVGSDEKNMPVKSICHEHPYQVEPDTKLHEVADEMAVHHYGCAIVVQNHKLVGIFTTVDACRAISTILEQRFHEHS